MAYRGRSRSFFDGSSFGVPINRRYRRGRSASSRRFPSARRTGASMRARSAAGRLRGRSGYARRNNNVRTAGFLGIENKFFDTAVQPVALTSDVALTNGEFDPTAIPIADVKCLSCPAQGDGEQNRDGKKIIIDSVQVSGCVQVPAAEGFANPPVATRVFVALVLDKQTNGAQLNSEDVFKSLGATGQLNTAPLRNMLHSTRFQVLRSEILDLQPIAFGNIAANAFDHGGRYRSFEWFVPLNLPTTFNGGTTAVVANVVDNSLHIIAFCNDITEAPTIAYNARIRFRG